MEQPMGQQTQAEDHALAMRRGDLGIVRVAALMLAPSRFTWPLKILSGWAATRTSIAPPAPVREGATPERPAQCCRRARPSFARASRATPCSF